MVERLLQEIHRRSLWQALALFMASGWAVLQVLDTLIDQGILPAWTFKAGLALLLLGLPVVLATAFVQGGFPGRAAKHDAGAPGDIGADGSPVSPPAGARSTDSAPVPAGTRSHMLTWRNAILGGVGAFALLGMGAGGWMGMRVLGVGPAATLAAQGLIGSGAEVVLADFESGDEAELGDVVTRTLRIDLMQSRMIRVLDRAQLNEPLARMELAPGARITSDVAAQLAEREGYAAVITGEVSRAGSGYVLTASIRAGDGFVPVAGFRETAKNDDELIGAIERLSRTIRDKAGESLRAVHGGPSLEQVTTSSLPALREYTRGEALEAAGDRNGALEHYERAVALDSMFAMAHRKLAVSLTNLQLRRSDAVRSSRRAYELRDRLPGLERELATAAYMRHVIGDLNAAAAAYERALVIDSTSIPVRNNLAVVYHLLGRHVEAARHYRAVLQLRPIAPAYSGLALQRYRAGDLAGALATVDSGMAALPSWHGGNSVKALFLAGRHQYAAADSLSRIVQQAAATEYDRQINATIRLWLLGVRGRIREAERVLEEPAYSDQPISSAADRAALEVMRGDTTAAIARVMRAFSTHGAEGTDHAEMIAALTLAGAGAEASAVLAAWRAAVPEDELGSFAPDRHQALARTQLVTGDFEGALRTLDDMQRRWPGFESGTKFNRARTYDAMGNATAAVEWYGKALDSYNDGALAWVPEITFAIRRLAELYDAQGNDAKAVEYYARFVELWKEADPELQPMVRRAEARLAALVPRR